MDKAVCKPGPPLEFSTTLKNVLIIGDSVSIMYTEPYLIDALADVALVQHAPWGGDGGAEETAYAAQAGAVAMLLFPLLPVAHTSRRPRSSDSAWSTSRLPLRVHPFAQTLSCLTRLVEHLPARCFPLAMTFLSPFSCCPGHAFGTGLECDRCVTSPTLYSCARCNARCPPPVAVPGQNEPAENYNAGLTSIATQLVAWAQPQGSRLLYALTSPMLCNVTGDGCVMSHNNFARPLMVRRVASSGVGLGCRPGPACTPAVSPGPGVTGHPDARPIRSHHCALRPDPAGAVLQYDRLL